MHLIGKKSSQTLILLSVSTLFSGCLESVSYGFSIASTTIGTRCEYDSRDSDWFGTPKTENIVYEYDRLAAISSQLIRSGETTLIVRVHIQQTSGHFPETSVSGLYLFNLTSGLKMGTVRHAFDKNDSRLLAQFLPFPDLLTYNHRLTGEYLSPSSTIVVPTRLMDGAGEIRVSVDQVRKTEDGIEATAKFETWSLVGGLDPQVQDEGNIVFQSDVPCPVYFEQAFDESPEGKRRVVSQTLKSWNVGSAESLPFSSVSTDLAKRPNFMPDAVSLPFFVGAETDPLIDSHTNQTLREAYEYLLTADGDAKAFVENHMSLVFRRAQAIVYPGFVNAQQSEVPREYYTRIHMDLQGESDGKTEIFSRWVGKRVRPLPAEQQLVEHDWGTLEPDVKPDPGIITRFSKQEVGLADIKQAMAGRMGPDFPGYHLKTTVKTVPVGGLRPGGSEGKDWYHSYEFDFSEEAYDPFKPLPALETRTVLSLDARTGWVDSITAPGARLRMLTGIDPEWIP